MSEVLVGSVPPPSTIREIGAASQVIALGPGGIGSCAPAVVACDRADDGSEGSLLYTLTTAVGTTLAHLEEPLVRWDSVVPYVRPTPAAAAAVLWAGPEGFLVADEHSDVRLYVNVTASVFSEAAGNLEVTPHVDAPPGNGHWHRGQGTAAARDPMRVRGGGGALRPFLPSPPLILRDGRATSRCTAGAASGSRSIWIRIRSPGCT